MAASQCSSEAESGTRARARAHTPTLLPRFSRMYLLRLQLDAAPPPPRLSPSSPQSWEEHSLCLPESPRGTSYVGVGWGEGPTTKTRKNKLDNQKNYSNCFHFPRARSADALPRPFPGFQSVGNTRSFRPPPLPQTPPLLSPGSRVPSLPPFAGVLERSAEYDE